MSNDDLPGFGQTFGVVLAVVLAVVIGIVLLGVASKFLLPPETLSSFGNFGQRDAIVYGVSWVILLAISVAATAQIREIIHARLKDDLHRRADQIAGIAGLVLMLLLFKQPYLDRLFGGMTAGFWINTLLLGGAGVSGWVVWYLKQLAHYGEFFNVLLMTVVTGFAWYARLTAPEEVQLTAVAFLLGSLFRLAKDYMDQANRSVRSDVAAAPRQ